MLESHSARETLLAKSTPQGFPFLRKICIFALSVGFILLATQSIQQKMGAKSPEISISGYPARQWRRYTLPEDLHQKDFRAIDYGWKDIPVGIDRAHIVPKSWIAWIWNNLKQGKRTQFAQLIIGPNKRIDQMNEGDLIWGEGNVRLGDQAQNEKIRDKFDPVFVEDDEVGKYKFDHKTRNMLQFLSTEDNWWGNYETVKHTLWNMKPLMKDRMIQSSGSYKEGTGTCEPLSVSIDYGINNDDLDLLKKIWNLPENTAGLWKPTGNQSIEDNKSEDGKENVDPQPVIVADTPQNQGPASSSSSDNPILRAKNT